MKKLIWIFFNRHGSRDQSHSDDATLVLAINLCEENYTEVAHEVENSLFLRKLVWDELEALCDAAIKPNCNQLGKVSNICNAVSTV